jgi:hypothetical protein
VPGPFQFTAGEWRSCASVVVKAWLLIWYIAFWTISVQIELSNRWVTEVFFLLGNLFPHCIHSSCKHGNSQIELFYLVGSVVKRNQVKGKKCT